MCPWGACLSVWLVTRRTTSFTSGLIVKGMAGLALTPSPSPQQERGERLPAHFLHALLACHRLAGTLASASVRAGTLTTDWQASTMAEATEAGDVTQTSDILLDFTAKEAFYLEIVFEHLGDSGEFIITQLACFTLGIDIESLTNLNAGGRPNAVQIAQRDVRGLIWRNVNTHNTGHANSPLTLSLLVARVCADHIYFAMSPYDLALIADTANT